MAKIIRNNNLFSEQNQIFICHLQNVFPANVGGSELKSHHACAEVRCVYILHMLLVTSEELVRWW